VQESKVFHLFANAIGIMPEILTGMKAVSLKLATFFLDFWFYSVCIFYFSARHDPLFYLAVLDQKKSTGTGKQFDNR
jgi:type IV secretory pathway TrbD component